MASLLTPGGSTHQSLLSLAPSSSSTISYYHTLPHPRSSGPLKSGSRSESNLITYLDDQLLQISRKYTKKYNESGYTTINAVVKDLERLVDILWVSSTPNLQTHYLLQIANSFNDYLASFSPRLKPTLRLLDTLDRCFYTLITGSSIDLSTPLSTESLVNRMNMTEKVRLKSIIERTRLHVIKLLEGGTLVPDSLKGSAQGTGDRADGGMDIGVGNETDVDGDNVEEEGWEIEVAKVYGRSLVQIGESLKQEG